MRPGLFSLLLPVLALAKGPSRLPSQHLSTSAHVSAQDHAGRIRSLVDLGLKVGPLEVNVDLAAGFSNASTKQNGTCSTPTVRREWRSLSDVEKEEYLASIKCLANSTALATSPEPVDGVKSLYDNFVATHIRNTDYVHFVGHFLPWHRYLVWRYEQALQRTCNYTGAQPYWDWMLDVTTYNATDAFVESPIFNDVLGFGGSGSSTNGSSYESFGCVEDGPFSPADGWVANMGPGNSTAYNPRCLTRGFNSTSLACGSQANVDHLLAQEDFWHFSATIDGRLDSLASNVHRAGHGGVGADMANVYSSPSDPLFFMHHANLDRLWTKWQNASPSNRTYDVSGNIYNKDWYGLRGNVTLDFEISWNELGGNKALRELMSTTGGDFCYSYE